MLTTIIPITISVAALGFSAFTWRERRSNDKRDLFLRMHERLIDLDLQHGRRILRQQVHSAKDVEKLLRDRYEDYEIVSRALSMLDIAALYVERGYIDKSLFMEEWSSVYAGLKESVVMLVMERAKSNPSYMWSWPHFQALANEAHKLTSGQGSQ